MECKLHSGNFSPVFVITGSKYIETNAEHDPIASCMFYTVSLCSHEMILPESSAVIRTGACQRGIR